MLTTPVLACVHVLLCLCPRAGPRHRGAQGVCGRDGQVAHRDTGNAHNLRLGEHSSGRARCCWVAWLTYMAAAVDAAARGLDQVV